ncbi:hypothetical protein B7Z17_05015 [Candidatus Saccharibacteria bacterium 32-49-10]|nr:MAG: hypothetical protein B7Z17_05015 [Candidatus Saccharibacteria bacterium 32-49-10]
MRRANVIEKDMNGISTLKNLTNVFESLASTQVAKVKNKATLSQEFFELIWRRYTAIRVNPKDRITNRKAVGMIETMQGEYNKDPELTDIIVLGSHGASQLSQRGIAYIRFFQVPESEHYIDVTPVIDAVMPYAKIIVYYEVYISLGEQEIRSIDLVNHVQDMSEDAAEEDIISTDDTIFEPSIDEIARRMEATMMNLALSQTILESGLAQAASRFNAMTVAEDRATDLLGEYKMEFHRAKRSESDRRLREVLVGIKKKRREARNGGKR